MTTPILETALLRLIVPTIPELLARIEALSPADRANVSPAWLEQLRVSPTADPWTHGFIIEHRALGRAVGSCGFKAPPDSDGIVEIAYAIDPEHQGQGYATEAAQAVVAFAFSHPQVTRVRAHTINDSNASARILTKCGFTSIGPIIDPEDGPVFRWEKLK